MNNFNADSKEQKYWNEDGGDRWVKNIEMVEALLVPLSNRLLQATAVKKGEVILDIGCGGGISSIKLAEQTGESGHVLGVDVSAPILEVALGRAAGIANLDFQQGDAATIDPGEAEFDLITSRLGVMFFDDPVSAFGNLHRLLKPSGRLVFLCWRTMEENPWMGEPARVTFEILPPPADAEERDPTAPGPFSLGDAGHLRGILESAGFHEIKAQPVDMLMDMGSLDAAVGFFLKLGPAADAISNANEEEKAAVTTAISQVLEKYQDGEAVHAPTASWIVTAAK